MSCIRVTATTDSDPPLISSSPPPPDPTANSRFHRVLRRLACSSPASSDVHAPSAATVRSSAEWQGKKSRRKRLNNSDDNKKEETSDHQHQSSLTSSSSAGPAAASSEMVWCGPGFADDSMDCVVRHHAMMMMGGGGGGRGRGGRHDAERIHREIMMFQTRMVSGRMMSGRMNVHDRYKDWRLDVDRMSYEELLELGDKIGYVNTGLREDEISRCLRKTKHSILHASPLYISTEMEKKCSICQEEYEVDDEMGKLECGHSYHIHCIKQWLLQKNACPVCKTAVTKA